MAIQPYTSTGPCNSNPTDAFNNPNNNYVVPNLGTCPGISDDKYFTFLPDGNAGIISGADTLATMDLNGVKIPVNEWVTKIQTLQSGEITYVPGLDKGLQFKTQVFDLPYLSEVNAEYYFEIDLSINYYNNFNFVEKSISGTSNFSNNIDINCALDLEFVNEGIAVNSAYDPSAMWFFGTTKGFEYEINNVQLTIIDASLDPTSPFPALIIDGERIPQTYSLDENKELMIPSTKYPNGAMVGYMMTAIYPNGVCPVDAWIYVNNVKSPFEAYYPQESITGISDIVTEKIHTFDGSINFGEVSIGFVDLNDVSLLALPVFPIVPDIDASIIDPSTSKSLNNLSILNSIINNPMLIDSYIKDSSIITSENFIDPSAVNNNSLLSGNSIDNTLIDTSGLLDPSTILINHITNNSISESEILGFYVTLGTDPSTIIQSILELNNIIEDSSIKNSKIISSYLNNNNIEGRFDASLLVIDASNPSELDNVASVENNISYVHLMSSYVSSNVLTKSTILNSNVYDSSIKTSEIYASNITNSEISTSEMVDVSISSSQVQSSSILNILSNNNNVINSSIFNGSIVDSSIQNSYVNYLQLDDAYWIPDASSFRSSFNTSNIYDVSINNAELFDCSIYTSIITDSSLHGCTIYNSVVDENNYLDENTRNVLINSVVDCSVSWTEDTSALYEKSIMKIDVGMNGSGDETILSAGDYLSYVSSHNLWNKTSSMVANFSTIDPEGSNIENLIGGFYVFNPQRFPVKVEYMLIN